LGERLAVANEDLYPGARIGRAVNTQLVIMHAEISSLNLKGRQKPWSVQNCSLQNFSRIHPDLAAAIWKKGLPYFIAL
jgi:hypothetical protein